MKIKTFWYLYNKISFTLNFLVDLKSFKSSTLTPLSQLQLLRSMVLPMHYPCYTLIWC